MTQTRTQTRRTVLALGVGALATPFLARGARASTGARPVVELFTSQGCSSCPPADRVLGELIGERVIALAYHVTYWDYLGWADPLATAEGTARQYAYAQAFGRHGVYTPQAVVNGRSHHVGSRNGEVRAALAIDAPALPVRIEAAGDALTVEVAEGTGAAEVMLVHFARSATHDIERGENGGRRLTYHHPVTAMERLGEWTGAPIRLDARRRSDGAAVLVQEKGMGPIVGAAEIV